MVDEESILGRIWSIRNPDGSLRSHFARLAARGTVEGYRHPNETSWTIENDSLVFRNAAGAITSQCNEFIINSDGQRSLLFKRVDVSNVVSLIFIENTEYFNLRDGFRAEDLPSRLRSHRGFNGDCRIGEDGFSSPIFSNANMEIVEVSTDTLPRLAEIGVKVEGPFGILNTIIFDRNMLKSRLTVRFNGGSLNAIILDGKSNVRGEFIFEGHENLVVAGAVATGRDVHVTGLFRYHAAALFLGAGGSAGQINVWIEGPGRSIQIGDDFLFSWGIWLRSADSHAIVDLASGQIVNPSQGIVIGPHVWLGQDALVMGGARIGGGAIVGARSIVTKAVPPSCVAVGAPAKVVRRRASWTRSAHPTAQDIAALRERTFKDC